MKRESKAVASLLKKMPRKIAVPVVVIVSVIGLYFALQGGGRS